VEVAKALHAALFSLSVSDSHIRPSRTLPRYSHVWLALQLAKYPLGLSQLAFYPCPLCMDNPKGVQTLRTQDTSDLRQFGTTSLVPKCLSFCVGAKVSLGHFSTSAEVSQHFMKGRSVQRTLRQ